VPGWCERSAEFWTHSSSARGVNLGTGPGARTADSGPHRPCRLLHIPKGSPEEGSVENCHP
jgi:hypothetical protein